MGKDQVNHRVDYCPIHGGENGRSLKLNLKSDEQIVGFYCHSCNGTLYIDTDRFEGGLLKKKVRGNSIINLRSDSTQSHEIYVADGPINHCSWGCGNKFTDLPDLNICDVEVPLSLKKCTNCGKMYVANDDYLEFESNNAMGMNQWRKNKIKFIKAAKQQEPPNHDDFINYARISVVPQAYLEANIRFNPYQYLPWLKLTNDPSKNILISDEVGLGKTIEAGIIIKEKLHNNRLARVLVVCPAFLRAKWQDELKEKFYLESTIFDNKLDYSSSQIDILPLSMLRPFLGQERNVNYDLIVVDEIHYFRNPTSERYASLKKIMTYNQQTTKVFMSATPINNKSSDYFVIREMLGLNHHLTNTTKKESQIDLPVRIIEDIGVELDREELKFYEMTKLLDPFSGTIYRHIGGSCLYALKKYAQKTLDEDRDTMEEINQANEELVIDERTASIDKERLRKIGLAALPVVDSKMAKLVAIINGVDDRRVVIFSHYIESIKYLFENVKKDYDATYIYGNNVSSNITIKNPKNKFQDVKNWFFEDSGQTKKILICSDSCKEGVDLQKANVLINYDLPFNPSILEQRIGRIDRNGQNKNMRIYNFHVVDTYDDRLDFILKTKLLIINNQAQYGIGNQLRVSQENETTLDVFVRYFKNKSNREFFSNEDRNIIRKLLSRVGIDTDPNMKLESLIKLVETKRSEIFTRFSSVEIEQYTKEQLQKRKEILTGILNFPSHKSGQAILDLNVQNYLVEKINDDPGFKQRMSRLIINYQEMLEEMENTGNPVQISVDDLEEKFQFSCSLGDDGLFIPRPTIEELENEGAKIIWE